MVWIAQSRRRTATGAISINARGHSPFGRSPKRTDASPRYRDKGRQSRQDQYRRKTQLGGRGSASWRIECGRQEGKLGDEFGERRQAGDHKAAANECHTEDAHRRWDCDPAFVKIFQLVFFAVKLSGHREHVRARLTASLDEFNQKERMRPGQVSNLSSRIGRPPSYRPAPYR